MENQNDFIPENQIPQYKEEPSAEFSADGLTGVSPQQEEGEAKKIQTDEENTVNIDQNQPPMFIYKTPIPKGHTEESYREKKKIKKAGKIIGFSFITMFAVIYILNFLVIIVSLGIYLVTKKESAINWTSDPFILHILQILFASFAFTVPIILVYKCFKIKIGKYISLKKPKHFLPLVFFGIGFCAFANVASSISASIFENFGTEIPSVSLEDPEGIFGFLIAFISTAIVPAFVEEFACRGLVMGVLRKISPRFAIVSSAILFGLMHGNFGQIPFAFMVGLVLGYIAIKADSLWPAIFVHFFNNLAAVVFSYLPISVNLSNILYFIFLCVCMALGIVGLLLTPKEKTFFEIKEPVTALKESKKYLYFFTSIPVCIAVVYCLVEAVFYLI